MKFQALGSNYSLSWALRQLLILGSASDSKALTKALEKRFGGHAYLFSKGRDALSEAVRLSSEEGSSRIAINSMTCSVVVEAATALDAPIAYLDIEPHSAHFSSSQFEAALQAHADICAVVIQNTYGRMCNIRPIEKIAREHNVLIIEDLAHSIGQTYPDGREAGTVGDLVMLSFGRDKLLDVTNGGALIVRSPQLTRGLQPASDYPSLLSQLRDRIYPILSVGVRRLYDMKLGQVLLGLMYRLKLAERSAEGGIHRNTTMPHWKARLALERLENLDALNAHRREIMSVYESVFGDALVSSGGTIRAALSVSNRSATLDSLREHGYELSDTWYDTPIGPARKYKRLNYPEQDCPGAVALSRTIINLPTHDEITEVDAKTIAEIIQQYV
ncbi:MAG TPA: DegT/DnrJ/EryC1/StrS family aminotransferase [Patescibacteria group bacterium]|jgi:dTDP-4-amino-4,6-dideoxygalactose transaminase|nr:DegT/DnrJ/EryC1/StrS family aminotransferase [Patescibacteria group bacterium]